MAGILLSGIAALIFPQTPFSRSGKYQIVAPNTDPWVCWSSASRYTQKLGDGEILAGDLPRKQLRLVQAWIELHRDELMADWELAVSGENPYKIAPL